MSTDRPFAATLKASGSIGWPIADIVAKNHFVSGESRSNKIENASANVNLKEPPDLSAGACIDCLEDDYA
ncbi:uncharacterized protein PADG_12285 [Paracoccidioides brasiliensis Pb18]|uniref:Uncharacterized protein n=1 Tax=Paracoccidioides brasiliensis (strain Pb18) TaxID=502780 RepID=A0A0A0HQW7_PARBD|nr:uncharacterized protein PADG_12285 [Paracoccidioides brasiliensis Pb18]KGM91604.1 hypothetical protein PADG_12285 [Paracoccidioides brasiliensis Pb18]